MTAQASFNVQAANTLKVYVGGRWPQFKNQNVQSGFNLLILGVGVTVAGTVAWARSRKKHT